MAQRIFLFKESKWINARCIDKLQKIIIIKTYLIYGNTKLYQ